MATHTAVNPETLRRPVSTLTTDVVDVSIIIVNWRSKDYVRQCLRSIACGRECSRYEVLVIDNASDDGCGTMLQEEFPAVRYIESRENLGFASANNLAFAQSRGRQILFLNPDTEIIGEAIRTLSVALDEIPEAGMVGARLLNSDLSLQTTCITALPSILNQTLNVDYLRRRFPSWSIWGMRPLFADTKTPSSVEAISGACMLAHREMVDRVGGFTTDYFMYAEDMDLCKKVTKAGKAVYYVPEATIIHHAGGSSAQREESHFSSIVARESLIRYLELHHGRIYAWSYRCVLILVCVARLLFLMIASPFALKRNRRFLQPVRKWANILLWSLGSSRWARQQPVRGS